MSHITRVITVSVMKMMFSSVRVGKLKCLHMTHKSPYLPMSGNQPAHNSTTPSVTSIGALHQEKARRVDGGSTKSCRCLAFPFHHSGLATRRPSEMLMAGAGVGDLLSPAGNILSDAIAHAHAHILSGSGVKVGLMLLAEESDKPGNIYGQIALG